MKERAIRVLIADDSALSRHMLTQLITAQPDMELIGSAASGREAVRLATDLQPNVVLMDIHMPDLDGIHAAWLISSRVPHGAVIMVTVEQRQDYLQKAMAAGARGYVLKPFGDGTALVANIRDVHKAGMDQQLKWGAADRPAEPASTRVGRKIAVFGSKGGVGKTTIAVALALALQEEAKRGTVLVDADFMFGDSATHLDLAAKHSIIDLLPYTRAIDSFLIAQVVESHASGLKILAPPARPEQAEIITGPQVRSIIGAMASTYEYVVVDTQPSYDERMLAVLDLADVHMIVLSAQLGALNNTRHFLDVAKVLGFPEDRMCFVLNRADSLAGLQIDDVSAVVGGRPIFPIPSAGASLSESINNGVPLFLNEPYSPFSQAIKALSRQVQSLSS